MATMIKNSRLAPSSPSILICLHAACDSSGTSSALCAELGSAMVVEGHSNRILGSPGRGYERSWWPALACVSLLSVQFLERESDA